MGITFRMHVVEPIHHLMEIGSGNDFWEFSCISNKIKEFASTHVLQNNSKTFISGLILFFVDGIFPDVNKTNQIFMIKIFHNIEFML